MRTVTASVESIISAKTISTCHLLYFRLKDQSTNTVRDYYLTDYFRRLTFNDRNYIAAGQLLNLSGMTETNDLQIQTMNFTLTGTSGGHLSAILQYDYIDREVEVHRAFLTDQDVLINDPVKIFQGRLNAPTISDDPEQGKTTITITASSRLSDIHRRPSRHTNTTEHQSIYPNDMFFSKWGKIDEEIIWGALPQKPKYIKR